MADSERAILSAGDSKTIDALILEVQDADTDALSGRTETLKAEVGVLNAEVAEHAAAHGDARRAFASIETQGLSAGGAAGTAEEARAELAERAEHYTLKRAQAVMLRWTIETYRARHQNRCYCAQAHCSTASPQADTRRCGLRRTASPRNSWESGMMDGRWWKSMR